MEQTSGPPHHLHSPAGSEPPACGLHSKRLKQLENAALQTSLISRMDAESGPNGTRTEPESGEDERSNGSSLSQRPDPEQPGAGTAEGEEPGRDVSQEEEKEEKEEEEEQRVEEQQEPTQQERTQQERTLTDHLNKRLLSSFLEKLNERDLALPGVQRLDCAVADEDSNRAAEDW